MPQGVGNERTFMKQRFRFEKQEARQFKQMIYPVTRSFPREELFGLTGQLRRAVISVSSNIAEGSGRNSDKDFAHFLEQAYGSLMETASLLFLSMDSGLIDESECDSLLEKADQLAGRIAALNRSLSVKSSKTPFAQRLPSEPSTLGSRPSASAGGARV
jgi:four helix bundle protein